MENTLLDALKGVQGDVVAENHSTSLSFEFGGSIIMKRGTFEQRIYFYARVSETKFKGVISIDDWDTNDISDIKLGELPIDNLSAFKQKLQEWGLSSMANKLDFSNTEEKIGICQCMLQDAELKLLYGKDFKVWELLSTDEQMLLNLQYVVDRFDSCGAHIKNQVSNHYGMGEQPTLKEFKKKLSEVSK